MRVYSPLVLQYWVGMCHRVEFLIRMPGSTMRITGSWYLRKQRKKLEANVSSLVVTMSDLIVVGYLCEQRT